MRITAFIGFIAATAIAAPLESFSAAESNALLRRGASSSRPKTEQPSLEHAEGHLQSAYQGLEDIVNRLPSAVAEHEKIYKDALVTFEDKWDYCIRSIKNQMRIYQERSEHNRQNNRELEDWFSANAIENQVQRKAIQNNRSFGSIIRFLLTYKSDAEIAQLRKYYELRKSIAFLDDAYLPGVIGISENTLRKAIYINNTFHDAILRGSRDTSGLTLGFHGAFDDISLNSSVHIGNDTYTPAQKKHEANVRDLQGKTLEYIMTSFDQQELHINAFVQNATDKYIYKHEQNKRYVARTLNETKTRQDELIVEFDENFKNFFAPYKHLSKAEQQARWNDYNRKLSKMTSAVDAFKRETAKKYQQWLPIMNRLTNKEKSPIMTALETVLADLKEFKTGVADRIKQIKTELEKKVI